VTPSEFSYELMIVSSKKTRKMWLSGDKNISTISLTVLTHQRGQNRQTDGIAISISRVAFMIKCMHAIKTDTLSEYQ